MEEMQALVDLGFYIGINGCSLRTEEGLRVAAEIPEELLLLETDCPWCGVKQTHPSYKYVKTHFPAKKREKYDTESMVKDRSEPATIVQILEIVAAIRDTDENDLAERIFCNSNKLFFDDH